MPLLQVFLLGDEPLALARRENRGQVTLLLLPGDFLSSSYSWRTGTQHSSDLILGAKSHFLTRHVGCITLGNIWKPCVGAERLAGTQLPGNHSITYPGGLGGQSSSKTISGIISMLNRVGVLKSSMRSVRRPNGGIETKVHGIDRPRGDMLVQEAVVAEVVSIIVRRAIVLAGGNPGRAISNDGVGLSVACSKAGNAETNDVRPHGGFSGFTVDRINVSIVHKWILLIFIVGILIENK
jgi:hypothetical protein